MILATLFLKFIHPLTSVDARLFSYNFRTKTLADRSEMIVSRGPLPLEGSLAFLFVVPPWPTTVADHHLERSISG